MCKIRRRRVGFNDHEEGKLALSRGMRVGRCNDSDENRDEVFERIDVYTQCNLHLVPPCESSASERDGAT